MLDDPPLIVQMNGPGFSRFMWSVVSTVRYKEVYSCSLADEEYIDA